MAFISQLSDLWRRRPNVVHWAAVGVVALLALLLVAGTTGRARSAAAAWGTSVRVLAAQTSLAVGSSPTEHVDLVEVPAHLVPAGALTSAFGLGELTRAVGTPVELMLFADIDPFDPAASDTDAARVPAFVLAASRDRWLVEIEPIHLDSVARASATGVVVPVVLDRNAQS